jgi:hypothetical protein
LIAKKRTTHKAQKTKNATEQNTNGQNQNPQKQREKWIYLPTSFSGYLPPDVAAYRLR